MQRRLDLRERGVDRIVGDDRDGVDVGQVVGGVEGGAAALPRCIDGVAALERVPQHRDDVSACDPVHGRRIREPRPARAGAEALRCRRRCDSRR